MILPCCRTCENYTAKPICDPDDNEGFCGYWCFHLYLDCTHPDTYLCGEHQDWFTFRRSLEESPARGVLELDQARAVERDHLASRIDTRVNADCECSECRLLADLRAFISREAKA